MSAKRLSERQWSIMNALKTQKSMSVEEMARHFDVTATTIRRELTKMQQDGLVTRSRGYAHLPENQTVSPFEARFQVFATEKELVAQYALKYIRSGETIIIDSGTTTYALACKIAESDVSNLQVITNSIPTASVLAHKCVTMVAGGTIEENTLALIGPSTSDFFENVAVDRLFLGATGINMNAGLTIKSQMHCGIKRKMMACANEIIALIDPSKFITGGANVFCKLQEVDRIITIHTTENESDLRKLEKMGIKVECADI